MGTGEIFDVKGRTACGTGIGRSSDRAAWLPILDASPLFRMPILVTKLAAALAPIEGRREITLPMVAFPHPEGRETPLLECVGIRKPVALSLFSMTVKNSGLRTHCS